MAQSVDIVVSELLSAAARLDSTAQQLKDGLSSVDDDTARLLGADWKGGAASAYAPAWEKWHDGAQRVVTGLQRMSELLTIAGREYAKTDESASGALDSTMQGSDGSASGSGSSGSPVGSHVSLGSGGANSSSTPGASQPAPPADDAQQPMTAAMQLGQVAGQPLSQVGQIATGLAQQVTQPVTAVAEQAGHADERPGE